MVAEDVHIVAPPRREEGKAGTKIGALTHQTHTRDSTTLSNPPTHLTYMDVAPGLHLLELLHGGAGAD